MEIGSATAINPKEKRAEKSDRKGSVPRLRSRRASSDSARVWISRIRIQVRMKNRKGAQSRVWGTATVGHSKGVLGGAVVVLLGQKLDDEKLGKNSDSENEGDEKRRSPTELESPSTFPL